MNYEERDTYGMYKVTAGLATEPDTSAGPGPRLMGAHTLIDNDVCNQNGEDLGDIKELMLGFYSAAEFGDLHEWFHNKATPLEAAGFVATKVQLLSRADASRVYALANELFMADMRESMGKANA